MQFGTEIKDNSKIFLGCNVGQKINQQPLSFQNMDLTSYDNGYLRNIGWEGSIQNKPQYKYLFSTEHLTSLQKKITQLLQGLDQYGRPIIVPIDTIASVLNEVVSNNAPIVGDIYTRYILPDIESNRNDFRDIVDRTIEIVVSSIRNEYETIQCNQKLTVWNNLLGDFNKQGLRAHAPLKMRNNGPKRFQFNMNGPACSSCP